MRRAERPHVEDRLVAAVPEDDVAGGREVREFTGRGIDRRPLPAVVQERHAAVRPG